MSDEQFLELKKEIKDAKEYSCGPTTSLLVFIVLVSVLFAPSKSDISDIIKKEINIANRSQH